MAKKSDNRVTSFLTPEIRTALDRYMLINTRGEADAIRILLTNALRTEQLLKEVGE